MDLRCQVWKWVWKMQAFGLKWGQDLENRPAHPPEEFPGVLPPAPRWFWSVLSSCITTGRISINNASILVVHCLIGHLLSAALYDCIIFFSLWGFYSFMFFFTSFFQTSLSVMEHFGCKHMATFIHLPSSHDKTVWASNPSESKVLNWMLYKPVIVLIESTGRVIVKL